jgi:hypothetical protein
LASAKSKFPEGIIRPVEWNSLHEPAPQAALENADVIFHLAGEPVAEGRWSDAKKRAIRESRVLGTRNLVAGIKNAAARPKVLVSASAVGYYGDRGDEILTEDAPPADDYLADVCVAWEQEAQHAAELGLRVVTMRIGIVLDQHGGALAKMLTPFKLGIGGPLGNGKMWMPWIHLHDLVSLLMHAAESDHLHGPVNAVGPNAVRNSEFTKAFAAALHRPAFLPIPYFGLRVLFGEFAKILFASQRVVPQAAERSGFNFQFPTIETALAEIFAAHPAQAKSPAAIAGR